MTEISALQKASLRIRVPSWYVMSGMLIAGLLMLPVIGVVLSIFQPSDSGLAYLFETVLPSYVTSTLVLSLGVAVGVFTIGVSTAWLVTMCEFPARRIFDWALILPLAVPAYVIAYAYTDFLQHAGPVQTVLRDVMNWGPRDYWFPNIRSLPGGILIFSLVFYPYVYLLARSAFMEQSTRPLEASRTLGATPWGSFFRVALPLARPSIAAGVALALMETLADYGAVAHFGIPTFTTGIYRAWFSFGDRILAAQLATGLLAFILVLLALERQNRGRSETRGPRQSFDRPAKARLSRGNGLLAFFVCALPVFLGFALPALLLITMAFGNGHSMLDPKYLKLTWNSFSLAGITAVLGVALALLLAYAKRLQPNVWTKTALSLAGTGYAIPGSIIAVGVLIPLANFDNALDGWMRAQFGISTGLLLTGSLVALIYAYLVRYMAISLQTVEASMARVTPNMDAAARSLGQKLGGVLTRIHMPIMRGSLLTAGLIVFVEVLKELPATLIMRPFNFDTLAIQAYRLASDERLAEAATPSLVIVIAGLLPVILLSRTIQRAR